MWVCLSFSDMFLWDVSLIWLLNFDWYEVEPTVLPIVACACWFEHLGLKSSGSISPKQKIHIIQSLLMLGTDCQAIAVCISQEVGWKVGSHQHIAPHASDISAIKGKVLSPKPVKLKSWDWDTKRNSERSGFSSSTLKLLLPHGNEVGLYWTLEKSEEQAVRSTVLYTHTRKFLC